jgi:hypothetical protein
MLLEIQGLNGRVPRGTHEIKWNSAVRNSWNKRKSAVRSSRNKVKENNEGTMELRGRVL